MSLPLPAPVTALTLPVPVALKRWLKMSAVKVNELVPNEVHLVHMCLLHALRSWGVVELVTRDTGDHEVGPLLTKMKEATDVMYKTLEKQPASVLISALCCYLIEAEKLISRAFKMDHFVRSNLVSFLRHLALIAPPGAPIYSPGPRETASMVIERAVDDQYVDALVASGHFTSETGQVVHFMFGDLASAAIGAVAVAKQHLDFQV
jgi:hypothetical protein